MSRDGQGKVQKRMDCCNENDYTEGAPNLSTDCVRTVFSDGPFWSTAQRTVLF
jgi:hypothetical protein